MAGVVSRDLASPGERPANASPFLPCTGLVPFAISLNKLSMHSSQLRLAGDVLYARVSPPPPLPLTMPLALFSGNDAPDGVMAKLELS